MKWTRQILGFICQRVREATVNCRDICCITLPNHPLHALTKDRSVLNLKFAAIRQHVQNASRHCFCKHAVPVSSRISVLCNICQVRHQLFSSRKLGSFRSKHIQFANLYLEDQPTEIVDVLHIPLLSAGVALSPGSEPCQAAGNCKCPLCADVELRRLAECPHHAHRQSQQHWHQQQPGT